jgi:hypothetical protein
MLTDGNLTAEEMLAAVEKDGAGSHGEDNPPQEGAAPPEDAGPQYLDLGQYGNHHLKYSIGDKEVEFPLEKVLKHAQMGYNYAQRAEGLNAREAEYNQAQERIKQLARWEEYDKYAQQNPEWAKHVENTWNNRGQVGAQPQAQSGQFDYGDMDPDNPLTGTVLQLQQTIQDLQSQFGEKFGMVDQFLNAQQISKEDAALDREINTAREQFGKLLNFDEPDDEGRNVEFKVLEHMKATGLNNFAAALKDLYFDELMTAKSQQLLEQQAAATQAKTKSGIIGTSPTPQSRPQANASTGQPRNYAEAEQAVLAALG